MRVRVVLASVRREPHHSGMNTSAALRTPTDLGVNATRTLSTVLNAVLADLFALHLKTRNFRWHMSGPHFREYQALFDEQARQLYAATDVIAERVRTMGALTMHSIGEVSRSQRLRDNDEDYVAPPLMLAELRDDNQQLAAYLREAHDVCDAYGDVASAMQIERWIDEAERRVWALFEAGRGV